MSAKFFSSLTLALVALFAQHAAANRDFLQEFHTNFTLISQETTEDLVYLRWFNGAMVEEFNRELLLQFGRMIPVMRAADVEALEVVHGYEGISEECREYVLDARIDLVRMQNEDVQLCAEFAWNALQADSLERFFPYHNSFARDNLAAINQVMETLGRTRLAWDPEPVRRELEGEMEYYENLSGGQVDVLMREIYAHADVAYETYTELNECREITEQLQKWDHEFMLELLMNDCYQ